MKEKRAVVEVRRVDDERFPPNENNYHLHVMIAGIPLQLNAKEFIEGNLPKGVAEIMAGKIAAVLHVSVTRKYEENGRKPVRKTAKR